MRSGSGLSPERRRTFFEDADGGRMKVKDNVKRLVNFRPQNLMDVIAQFKADHADELSQEKEKMWCLLMPEDEEQDAPGDAQESEEKNQVSLH